MAGKGKSSGIAAAILFATAGVHAQEVLDQRGHKFSFSKPAERVVFLPMPAPSTYIAIDGSERHIVGMNAGSAPPMRDGILGRLFPGTRSISTDVTTGAGFMPNLEAILALQPDTVFQWSTAGEDPIALLDRAGLRTLGMRYGTQQDMAGYVAMMGMVSGKPERAAEIIGRQKERLNVLADALAGLPNPDRPRVLYLGRATDSLSAAGAGTYADFYIGLAGGRNVAASSRPTKGGLTLEQVLAWDPEVVLQFRLGPSRGSLSRCALEGRGCGTRPPRLPHATRRISLGPAEPRIRPDLDLVGRTAAAASHRAGSAPGHAGMVSPAVRP